MHRPLPLTRWLSCVLLIGIALAPRPLPGQAALVEHALVFDMKMSLPAGWTRATIPGLQELVDRMDEWTRELTEERVQTLAADFQRTPILRAWNPQRTSDQAIVTFRLLAGFHVHEFEASAQELAASLVSSHCEPSRAVIEQAGGTASCDRFELRQIGDWLAVVVYGSVRLEANGIDNRRTVVLMPVDGGLFSFVLSVHQSNADTSWREQVIGSIRGPAR